ncbi:MAG: ABC transporter permease, partial [Phycisphaeraceae bacterium]
MKRPIPWLIVLVLLLALGEGLGALLWAQGEVGASSWLRLIGRVAAAGWLLWGLHVWREVPWVDKARRAVIALAAVGILAAVSAALGWSSLLYILAGVVGMSVTFFVGLWLVRLALSAGSPVIGVARTVVDEAIRMRMPVVFIVGVILVVPVLPFVLDPSDRLEYRLQSFLSWSSIAVSLLLSLMTIFLAIGTLTRELERRQVFLSLTKPVRRWQYLLGKWLGIASLNVVLVATAGVGVYAFTRFLASQPAIDVADREAVAQRVLVARDAVSPQPPDPDYFRRAFDERVRQMRSNDPRWMA